MNNEPLAHDARLHAALQGWNELLGTEYLDTDSQHLQAAESATFSVGQRIVARLRPADRAEVQACVRIANRYKIPLYPISSGRNWGYGSAVPVMAHCAVLDLRRLSRIVDYDDKLGYVTLEPGVTQQQLYDFLQAQGGKFWMDATGASTACSVIGNTMERGFGHSPYSDHAGNACALEVVLPSGDCIHSGFGRFPNALATPVYRWGVGPSLDGLFTQSNLGIVTQMTVWLLPAPEYFQAYYFSVEQDQALAGLIEALRPLRLRGTVRSAIHIGNAYRVLSSIQQYPWQAAGGVTPLPPPVLHDLGRQWDFGFWNGSGALYGNRREVAEARRQIKQALRGRVKKLRFIDDRLLAFAERWQRPLHRLSGINLPDMLKIVRPVHDMMKGIPTERIIASTYWRKKMPVPALMDPDRDRCGLFWCSPIAPTRGDHARTMADIATDTLVNGGFEPGITLTLLTERALECVISISYDRDIPGEDERALACYNQLLSRLLQQGFYPYRLGIQSMQSLPPLEDSSRRLQKLLKDLFDPAGIMAPGRYSF